MKGFKHTFLPTLGVVAGLAALPAALLLGYGVLMGVSGALTRQEFTARNDCVMGIDVNQFIKSGVSYKDFETTRCGPEQPKWVWEGK